MPIEGRRSNLPVSCPRDKSNSHSNCSSSKEGEELFIRSRNVENLQIVMDHKINDLVDMTGCSAISYSLTICSLPVIDGQGRSILQ